MDSLDVANALSGNMAKRFGLPLSDNYRPLVTKADLHQHLFSRVFDGTGAVFTHPNLPGMEFSADVSLNAISLVIETEKRWSGLSTDSNQQIDALLSANDFVEGCKIGDRRKQLRAALEVLSIDARAQYLIANTHLTGVAAYDQAASDFQIATDIEERLSRESPPGTAPSEVPEPAPSVTLATPAPVQLVFPYGNSTVDSELEWFLPAKVDNRTGLIRQLSRTLSYFLVFGSADSGIPDVYLEAVTRLRGAPRTRQFERRVLDASLDHAPEGDELVEHTGFSYDHKELVSAATSLVDRSGPIVAVSLPLPAIELVFPFGNQPLDTELEQVLPPNADTKSALIRQVARNMIYYVRVSEPTDPIEKIYEPAVRQLRANFSYDAIVRFST
ncbi:hypothetical protein HZC07_05605, partial [Candidatus Micrarchaeota archaeon]|nr:hypothetical protein [Candidatus Micrarchaeota archaeon]